MHNGGAMAEMVTVLTGLSLFVVMVLLCARQRSQMYAHSYMASGQAGFPPQGYMVRGYSDAGYGPGHVAASGATGFLGGMMLHEAMSERHQNAYGGGAYVREYGADYGGGEYGGGGGDSASDS